MSLPKEQSFFAWYNPLFFCGNFAEINAVGSSFFNPFFWSLSVQKGWPKFSKMR